MNIFAILNESAGKRFLKLTRSKNFKIKGIYVTKSSSEFKFYKNEVKKHNARLFCNNEIRKKSFSSWIKKNDIDILINVHSNIIICNEVLTSPQIGSFNLHPGPLPEYAGLNPISWAIYNGEKKINLWRYQ